MIVTPCFAQSASSYLATPNLAVPFDWQNAWGSIHVNSYADGLNDPGIPSTVNGVVPCTAGTNQCGGGVAGGTPVHGIKYDIKNSVVNCMSVQLPNWSYRGDGFSDYVCSLVGKTRMGEPHTIVYLPLEDSRSNDTTFLDPAPGYQQQVANNCIHDIYSYDQGGGAMSPVGHVFSASEKSSWILGGGKQGLAAGAQLPNAYYYYQQKSDNSWVYSSVMPATGVYVAGTLSTVKNYSQDLASIQAYSIADSADADKFIIVDPNPFYDLRRYSYDGSPEPYANCPVLGLKMYDGICDPTGYAGCNLPVYGVGPTTTFTGQSGATSTYNNYPIMWSGYALAWSFITPTQYWNNVKSRQDIMGAPMYKAPVNTNPVLMLVRADSYCTNEEMTSDPTSGKTNLPCIQYLQYVTTSGQPLGGQFMDLYGPHEDVGTKDNAAAYVVKHDYNINPDGSLGSPVLGPTGSPVSFFDTTAQYTTATGGTAAAVNQIQPPGSPITNSQGQNPRPGILFGDGAGIKFEHGTSIAVQLDNQTIQWQGKPVNCIEFTNAPKGTDPGDDIFVPTNTLLEFQSFADAVSAGMNPVTGMGNLGGRQNVTGRACQTHFKLYASDGNGSDPNGTQTWYGTTSCSQIPAPSCNQVTTISAQRYCQRPTGLLGDCSECAGVPDPDSLLNPGDGGVISNYNVTNDANGTDVCYFQAYCHSTSSCPGLATGGHVFCLAPDSKIMMSDGTEKNIDSLKAGDEVMAFDAKHSRGMLRTAKVKATAVTEKQKLVQINDLKITPLHKIILSNGRAVMAKTIKVGDKILKASGMIEKVTKVKKNLPPVTVYNLSLEGADGYVADGLRVLEYPVPDGLVK